MDYPHFGSDNASGVAPEILEAIMRCNEGGVDSYGGDAVSEGLDDRFSEVFETAVSVLPVGTGSIANELALALLSPPWGAIYCSSEAHIVVDEANGPEFFTGGAKLVDLPGDHGRISEESVREAASAFDPEDVHHPKPAVLSITQACECGTLYSLDDIRALGDVARDHGLSFHMDGARFANAIAALGCSPAEITWKAGVDVLSFGATKNGCMAAEAIVLFGETRKDLPILRRLHKRAGQLYSKMRFISAQLAGYLDSANWLRWASHANGQAKRLAEGLCAVEGVSLIHPVEVNEVFLSMPLAVFDRLRSTGFGFYPIQPIGDGMGSVRLVTSFNTDPHDIERLIAAANGWPLESG